MSAVRLTMSQRYMMARAPEDWDAMPPGVGCTNSTLNALEKRGLLETRITPGSSMGAWLCKWQWRKTPEQQS